MKVIKYFYNFGGNIDFVQNDTLKVNTNKLGNSKNINSLILSRINSKLHNKYHRNGVAAVFIKYEVVKEINKNNKVILARPRITAYVEKIPDKFIKSGIKNKVLCENCYRSKFFCKC